MRRHFDGCAVYAAGAWPSASDCTCGGTLALKVERRLRRLWRWWRLRWAGEGRWRPFALYEHSGVIRSGDDPLSYVVRVNAAKQLTLSFVYTLRGLPVREEIVLEPYCAWRLGSSLRDHALAVGGLPYMTPEDHRRQQKLYDGQVRDRLRRA